MINCGIDHKESVDRTVTKWRRVVHKENYVLWGSEGRTMRKEFWTNEGRDLRKRGMICEEVKAELKWVRIVGESLWGRERRAGRKWGRSCEEVCKKCAEVKGELWGSGGVIKKLRKDLDEIKGWNEKCMNHAESFYPLHPSVCPRRTVWTPSCMWSWMFVRTSTEVHRSLLPALFISSSSFLFQLKHSCNKWIRIRSSIYLLSQKHYSKKCLNDRLRVNKSYSFLVKSLELSVQHMALKSIK